mgnify:CR=1 FL=1
MRAYSIRINLNAISTTGTKFLDRLIIFTAIDTFHTDNIPISNDEFPSNWELSVARAIAVSKIMIENGIQHNKHIFVEKPICWKNEEIGALLKMSKNYQSIIQVGHIERYNPTILKIIENKQINLLGGIKYIEAERIGALNKRNEKIPITLDIMIHDIDLILSIIKSEIKEVIVDHNNNINNVSCEIIFQSGQHTHLKSQRDRTSQKNKRTMNIVCEKGELKIDFSRKTIHMLQKDETKLVEINTDKNINSLREEFVDFQYSIQKKIQPLVGIQEGCQAVKLALNIENNINPS